MTETKVIMKLRRQFYNMKNRQDLTGFKVSTLENGFSRFVMDVSLSCSFFFLSKSIKLGFFL